MSAPATARRCCCCFWLLHGSHTALNRARARRYLPPATLSGVSAPRCRFAVIADQYCNDASSRRQSKLDNQKSGAALGLEGPLEAVALLSLAGVGCVVANQWASSATANARLALEVWKKCKEAPGGAGGGSAPGAGAAKGAAAAAAAAAVGTPLARAVRALFVPVRDGGEAAAAAAAFKLRVQYNPMVYGLSDLMIK